MRDTDLWLIAITATTLAVVAMLGAEILARLRPRIIYVYGEAADNEPIPIRRPPLEGEQRNDRRQSPA